MTTLVVAISGDEAWAGADQHVGLGGTKLPVQVEKFTPWNEVCVGFAGDAALQSAVRRQRYEAHPKPNNMNQLCEYLREDVRKNLPSMPENFEALAVARGQIWHIDSNFDAIALCTSAYAVGSGADFALGSLFHTTGLNPERRVRSALQAAAHHDSATDDRHVLWKWSGSKWERRPTATAPEARTGA